MVLFTGIYTTFILEVESASIRRNISPSYLRCRYNVCRYALVLVRLASDQYLLKTLACKIYPEFALSVPLDKGKTRIN